MLKNEIDESQISQYIFDENDFINKRSKERINKIIQNKDMYLNDINLYSDFRKIDNNHKTVLYQKK